MLVLRHLFFYSNIFPTEFNHNFELLPKI